MVIISSSGHDPANKEIAELLKKLKKLVKDLIIDNEAYSIKMIKYTESLKFYTKLLIFIGVITIMVGVFTIYSTTHIFDEEKRIDLENHINDLEALEYELKMNLDLLNDLEKKEKDFLNNSNIGIYNEFVVKNLEKIVSEGKMQNEVTRSWLIKALFKTYEVNNGFKALVYQTDLVVNETKKNNIKTQIFKVIKTELKDSINTSRTRILTHITCLKQKRDYLICYN